MTDNMDEALDLFKRVWNRRDLDAETQIEQIRIALSEAKKSGREEERERCAKIIEAHCPDDSDPWFDPMKSLCANITNTIKKVKP